MKRAGLTVLVFLLINLGAAIQTDVRATDWGWLPYLAGVLMYTVVWVGALELYAYVRNEALL